MSTAYQSSYLAHSNQATQNQELVPVYPQQPLQVVYPPAQPSQQTSVMYSSPGPVLYTQNPVYPYPPPPPIPQNIPHYPQSTSTPNSCSSSVSNNAYCRQVSEVPLQTVPVSSFSHITQNMSQLSIGANPMNNTLASSHQNYNSLVHNQKIIPQHFDNRQKSNTPKGNKYNGPKNFAACSSQNSTGTSSPATTVAAGYAGNPSSGMYRPAPENSPLHTVPLGYGHNFVQPILCRQVSVCMTLCMTLYRCMKNLYYPEVKVVYVTASDTAAVF